MKRKIRLDTLLSERYPHCSRSFLQRCIKEGQISVNNGVVTKPAMLVDDDASIASAIQQPKYVSRAGFKLEKALVHWSIDVSNKIALDAGISTGGFTDCLLQHGVRKVYGIDVGHAQLHATLRSDTRLVLYERTNLRYLETVGERVDVITLDLSFISVSKVMDAVKKLLKPGGMLIVLIKPQFEVDKHEIGKGGIVKDNRVHQRVVNHIEQLIVSHGFTSHGIIESPLPGSDGNKEFLSYFIRHD